MQRSTAIFNIVTTEPVLVPPVVNRLDISGEDEEERWEGAQIVNPCAFLQFHPALDLLLVIPEPPSGQIHDHYSSVEVAGGSRSEDPGKNRVGPELLGEVIREIGMAILGCSDDSRPGQFDVPELVNVVDDDHVGVKVNDSVNAGIKNVAQVISSVVQRVL